MPGPVVGWARASTAGPRRPTARFTHVSAGGADGATQSTVNPPRAEGAVRTRTVWDSIAVASSTIARRGASLGCYPLPGSTSSAVVSGTSSATARCPVRPRRPPSEPSPPISAVAIARLLLEKFGRQPPTGSPAMPPATPDRGLGIRRSGGKASWAKLRPLLPIVRLRGQERSDGC